MNHYETVFILNPVLSQDQIKEAVNNLSYSLTEKSEFINKENWGLKKLAYPIQNKKADFIIYLNSSLTLALLIHLKLNLEEMRELCVISPSSLINSLLNGQKNGSKS